MGYRDFKGGIHNYKDFWPKTNTPKEKDCIFTRLEATKVGATTMDRPEWIASNPKKNEVCCCLTNNKNRGIKANKGGDKVEVDKVNPRKNNKYGQIVRWKPRDGNHSSIYFKWNLFVVAGNPKIHEDNNSEVFVTDKNETKVMEELFDKLVAEESTPGLDKLVRSRSFDAVEKWLQNSSSHQDQTAGTIDYKSLFCSSHFWFLVDFGDKVTRIQGKMDKPGKNRKKITQLK